MPYITQVALGKRNQVNIFGGDYATKEGTGVRDYIHVSDLAKAHLKALEQINNIRGIESSNLGTGQGYSVLEVINVFQQVNNINVPYKIVERRLGDVAECYANPQKAETQLHWKAEKTLADMCRDAWSW